MRKNLHIINILAILVILAIVFAGGIFYLFTLIKEKNENVSNLKNYLSSGMGREDYVVSTQRLLQSMDGDIKKIRSSIVSSTDDVEFIESLEALAKANSLVIKIDSLVLENDPKASTTVSFLRIKANTSGNWKNTYKFISQLESMTYKIRVNSLLVSNIPQSSSGSSKQTISRSSWVTSFDIGVLKYK